MSKQTDSKPKYPGIPVTVNGNYLVAKCVETLEKLFQQCKMREMAARKATQRKQLNGYMRSPYHSQ
jgi:hypothetical protein